MAYRRRIIAEEDDREEKVPKALIMGVAEVCAGCGKKYPRPGCEMCRYNPAQYTTYNNAVLMRIHYEIKREQKDYATLGVFITLVIFFGILALLFAPLFH
jgi:hypothetical protein